MQRLPVPGPRSCQVLRTKRRPLVRLSPATALPANAACPLSAFSLSAMQLNRLSLLAVMALVAVSITVNAVPMDKENKAAQSQKKTHGWLYQQTVKRFTGSRSKQRPSGGAAQVPHTISSSGAATNANCIARLACATN